MFTQCNMQVGGEAWWEEPHNRDENFPPKA